MVRIYIPTLQEYAKKRKKEQVRFIDPKNCSECDFYRCEYQICVWGNCIRSLKTMKTCPVTARLIKKDSEI